MARRRRKLADLPALYSIQRDGAPDRPTYLTVMNSGDLAWGLPSSPFNLFDSERSAETFRCFRMGAYGESAEVVRHTVH